MSLRFRLALWIAVAETIFLALFLLADLPKGQPIDLGRMSIVFIGGMAINGLIAMTIAHVFTRRLSDLADAADAIAAGNPHYCIVAAGDDDIARLGRAFNNIVARMENHLAACEGIARSADQSRQKPCPRASPFGIGMIACSSTTSSFGRSSSRSSVPSDPASASVSLPGSSATALIEHEERWCARAMARGNQCPAQRSQRDARPSLPQWPLDIGLRVQDAGRRDHLHLLRCHRAHGA